MFNEIPFTFIPIPQATHLQKNNFPFNEFPLISVFIGQHYSVEKKDQKVELTPAGFKYAEQIVGV